MWVTRSEREWRRKEEERLLREAAQQAESRFAAVIAAIEAISKDPVGGQILARLNIKPIPRGRSSRLAVNGRAEGLAVLEGVVLAGTARNLLADAELVPWLSRQYPRALAVLHEAAG
jgi:hypothetical protein